MNAVSATRQRRPQASNRVAVIDIGSNSARVMVYERDTPNHLRLLAGSRASLRLVRDVDKGGQLTEATMARTMAALRDFSVIATSMAARRIVAVATAAMREAENGALFMSRVERELGLRIEIIDGLVEARYGFTGAVRGLTVSNGMVFDLGGGSIQITRFANRRLVNTISLPFGALRLSQRFLESNPPSRKQLGRLRDHVRRGLDQAHVGRLAPADRLVGTGGTLRNLAKIDRQMRHYPVHRVHGYVLSFDHLSDVTERLAKTTEHRRDDIPGLSAERSDSIVGGAVAISTLAEFVRAKDILVSGQGLREGIALGLFKLPIGVPTAVKEAALVSLVSRFDGWRADAAARRRGVAAALQRLLDPSAPTSLASAVDDAARVLDIGRTLDVVNRHEHTADILLTTDLDGFSHQELALASAITRRAGDRHADVLSRLPVGHKIKEGQLDRAAIVLGLADEIEARCLPRRPISVQCDIGRNVTLSIGSLQSWLVKDLDKRFEHAFGRPLIVKQRI